MSDYRKKTPLSDLGQQDVGKNTWATRTWATGNIFKMVFCCPQGRGGDEVVNNWSLGQM